LLLRLRLSKVKPARTILSATGALGHADKHSCIVLEGTPDLSGRTLNHTSPLPHACGVPSQCPGVFERNQRRFCRFIKQRACGWWNFCWPEPRISC
jgi:hypothetical protein